MPTSFIPPLYAGFQSCLLGVMIYVKEGGGVKVKIDNLRSAVRAAKDVSEVEIADGLWKELNSFVNG